MKIDDIKAAYVAGKPVPPAYAGEAIAKDPEMLFSYLADHNPVIVNKTLRGLPGNNFLPVVPDRAQIGGILNGMIRKGEWAELQKVVNDWVSAGYNANAANYTTDPQLQEQIIKHLS